MNERTGLTRGHATDCKCRECEEVRRSILAGEQAAEPQRIDRTRELERELEQDAMGNNHFRGLGLESSQRSGFDASRRDKQPKPAAEPQPEQFAKRCKCGILNSPYSTVCSGCLKEFPAAPAPAAPRGCGRKSAGASPQGNGGKMNKPHKQMPAPVIIPVIAVAIVFFWAVEIFCLSSVFAWMDGKTLMGAVGDNARFVWNMLHRIW